MEEIEILSWMSLDALKEKSAVVETVGNLQTEHYQSVFCTIEDDLLELCYSDTASNYLRRYEDKEEFELALKTRKEEMGDAPYDDDRSFEGSYEDEENEEDYENSEEF